MANFRMASFDGKGNWILATIVLLGGIGSAFGQTTVPVPGANDATPEMTEEEIAIATEQMGDIAKLVGLPALSPVQTEQLAEKDRLAREAQKNPAAAATPPAPAKGVKEGEKTAEDLYYEESMENRRNVEEVPNTALVLRRFAHYLIDRYDKNRDGKLQESEWSQMPGAPQGIDMNGDLVLEEYEILYYLARYAKGRTIAQPIPPSFQRKGRTLFRDSSPIMIHPLSAPMRVTTPALEMESDKEDKVKISDMSEEELDGIIDQTDEIAGEEGDPELFGLLASETDFVGELQEYAAGDAELEGVPNWFRARDKNGDGQLSLREFAPTLSVEATALFGQMDANSDGLVTPEEVKDFTENGPKPKDQTTKAE